MQGFGYFFRQIKYNFIYFTRIDSGYARIRRYVSALNRRAARLGKKISAFAYAPQNATVLSKGPFRGGGRNYKKNPTYANYTCINLPFAGFLTYFRRGPHSELSPALGNGRAQLLGLGEILSFFGGDNKCNHFYIPIQKVLSRF